MTDEQQSHEDGILHYEGGIPVFDTRLNKLENEAREAKERDDNYKEEQLKLNRRVVWFTGILAAVGLIGGAISAYQTHIASINASAAQKNAAAAEANAKAAESQADAARKTVDEMKKSGLDTHQLALNSEESLANTKKSLRPWVDAQKISSPSDIREGSNRVVVEVDNSGSSPALHAVTYMEIHPMCGPDAQDFPHSPEYSIYRKDHPSTAMLLPGMGASLDHYVTLGPDDMISLNMRVCTLYSYGTVTYCDLYGRFHWQHYCAKWVGGSRFDACFGYEDGDQDYPKKPLHRCPKEPSAQIPIVP